MPLRQVLPVLILALYSVGAAADEPNKTIPIIGKVKARLSMASAADRKQLEALLGKEGLAIQMEEPSGGGKKDEGYPVIVEKNEKVGEIKVSEIASFVKDVRSGLCSTLSKGDEIKFTVAWNASLKILGLGGDATTGIEVTVKCG